MERVLCAALFLLAALPRPAAASAAVAEAGLPLMRIYSAAEYDASPENWAVTQGPDGILYVGNVDDGVLVFDGSRWQRVPIPGERTVRALATGTDGRIYVGTVGDFGYLRADATGELAYVSLLGKVPPAERNFSDVWRIHVAPDGVYFATLSRVFHLQHGHVSVITPRNAFHLSFLVNGEVVIRDVGRGLMRIVNDRLVPLPGGDRFANERVYALLAWKGGDARPGELLAGTRTDGWFRFDGAAWHPWQTGVDRELGEAQIYDARWLADGRLAVATLRGGVFFLDPDGRPLGRLTRTDGLATNTVLALFEDRQQDLWLATDNGVVRVDAISPLSHYGDANGLTGAVLALARSGHVLYAGTTDGLFRLGTGADGVGGFHAVPGATGQTWALLPFDGQLLAANNDGVAVVEGGGARPVVASGGLKPRQGASALLRSRADPARVFVAYVDGLGSLRWTDGHWVDEGRIAAVDDRPTSLAEDADGRLWIGSATDGTARISFPTAWRGPADPRAVTLERFDSVAGLPDGRQDVVSIGASIRFLTSTGMYRFDAVHRRFAPDPVLTELFPGQVRGVRAAYQDRGGALWMYTTRQKDGIRETGRAQCVGTGWQWSVTPLQPISGSAVNAFLDDADGVTWLGGDSGLFRYDTARMPAPDVRFGALIRRVTTSNGHAITLEPAQPDATPEVPFADNSLRFEFGAPSFDGVRAARFQVMLEGFDRDWSAWRPDAYRDYTNLHEGAYRLRVRVRDAYGEEGSEATWAFRVLPPWYRTPWAWALWILSGLLAVVLITRWRSARLHHRNRALAAIVEVRTAELAQANRTLARQAVTDPLTGLRNRRHLHHCIEGELASARDSDASTRTSAAETPEYLFLMIDIDHFKEINDTHGHAAGDRVLRQFRDILLGASREHDTLIRWGGEEFLIAARAAPANAGPRLAERIRAAVAAHRFDLGDGRSIHRTCSIGFACYPAFASAPERLDWEQAIALADEALYAAKHHGRNAWAGVLPASVPPEGDPLEALRGAFAHLHETGSLCVEASWQRRVQACA